MATTGWSNDDCIFDKGLPRPRHLISRTIGLQQSLRFAQWTPQSCQHSASSNRPTSIERIQRRRLSCEHECQHVVAPVSVHSLLGKAAKEWICKSFIPGYRVLEPPVRAVNLGHHLPRMTHPPCVRELPLGSLKRQACNTQATRVDAWEFAGRLHSCSRSRVVSWTCSFWAWSTAARSARRAAMQRLQKITSRTNEHGENDGDGVHRHAVSLVLLLQLPPWWQHLVIRLVVVVVVVGVVSVSGCGQDWSSSRDHQPAEVCPIPSQEPDFCTITYGQSPRLQLAQELRRLRAPARRRAAGGRVPVGSLALPASTRRLRPPPAADGPTGAPRRSVRCRRPAGWPRQPPPPRWCKLGLVVLPRASALPVTRARPPPSRRSMA